MQGQCKPNAESSLYVEVQPVLAISTAKLGVKSHQNKKNENARLAWALHYEGTIEKPYSSCFRAFSLSFSSLIRSFSLSTFVLNNSSCLYIRASVTSKYPEMTC